MDHTLSENSAQNLTRWKNEPSIRQLKQDFEMAKPSHDSQMLKIQHWNDLMQVKGKARPVKIKGRSSVQPKLIRRQAEWRYSALTEPFLGTDRMFKVKPTTFEDQTAAEQNALVINWQWQTKINRVKFIDDYVRSVVDEGTCIVQLGWKRSTMMVKEDVPVFTHYAIENEEQANQLKAAIELKESNPREYEEGVNPLIKAAVSYYEANQVPTYAVQTGTEKVDVEKVLENKPTYKILNPQNFYIDPSSEGDIEKALFAALSFETCKADLIKEPKRYKNLDKVNWESNTPLSQPDHESTTPDTFQFQDALRKRVVAYEYWGWWDTDGTGNLKPIVATWIGDVIIRMEANPFPDEKLPFVVVPYLPVKRELFGEPDAEMLEDNQKILGAVTRGMIDLLGRSANGQQGFAKGMLDPLNRRRYENGQDYEFNPNQSIQQGLIEHKYPELPQSGLLMLNLQNQEAEALTGVKSFSGGMSGESYGDVAAGVKGAMDASAKREMAILRRLAKGMMEIGTKTISMNQVFLSAEEVIRVTNEKFVKVKREDLKGNFDLDVDISTAEVDEAKARDLAFMLQTIGNNMDIGITLMILAEIATLKRMPALAKKLLSYKPQKSPEQEEMEKLQLEKLKLENQELVSKIALNDAKAKQALAQKDKTDLDYVEQETGTTHAREIEKSQAQARGNQNLQVTKALTSPTKEGEKAPDVEAAIGFNELSEKLGKTDPIGTSVGSAPQLFPEQPSIDIPQQRDELGGVDPALLGPAIEEPLPMNI